MIQIPDDLSICKDITHNKIKLLHWLYTSIYTAVKTIQIPLMYIVKDEQLMY